MKEAFMLYGDSFIADAPQRTGELGRFRRRHARFATNSINDAEQTAETCFTTILIVFPAGK